jgi:hypothetical protein
MLSFVSRPIRPEPAEFPSIRKAMRAARFMKWGATPLAGLAMFGAVLTGAATEWYWGVAVFVGTWGILFGFGYASARCPRCGQVWWSNLSLLTFAPWAGLGANAESGDETETFVCRKCRLDLGVGLQGPRNLRR